MLGDLEWPFRLAICLPRDEEYSHSRMVGHMCFWCRNAVYCINLQVVQIWQCRPYCVCVMQGLHPLLGTAWRCFRRSIDHLITCESTHSCGAAVRCKMCASIQALRGQRYRPA